MIFILPYQLIQTISLQLKISISSYTLIIMIKSLDRNFILLPFFVCKASLPHTWPTVKQISPVRTTEFVLPPLNSLLASSKASVSLLLFELSISSRFSGGGRDTNEILNYLNTEASRNTYLHLKSKLADSQLIICTKIQNIVIVH